MRRFVAGMALGLVLGTTLTASAAYVGKVAWEQNPGLPVTQAFHLGYVAGAIDTIQALKKVSFLSRQTVAEGLDKINQCTQSLRLGEAVERAEVAVTNTASTANVADAILGNFIKCP
jgi:hypothetical protein